MLAVVEINTVNNYSSTKTTLQASADLFFIVTMLMSRIGLKELNSTILEYAIYCIFSTWVARMSGALARWVLAVTLCTYFAVCIVVLYNLRVTNKTD